MGRMQRNKGAGGEREIVNLARAHGFTAARTRSGNGQERGDIMGIPGCHGEVKRTERAKPWEWIEQATGNALPGEIPVVFFRRNRSEWQAIIPADDLLALVAAREHS